MKIQPAGLSRQCKRTDRLLWEAYARSGDQSEIPDRCRLLFPREREKEELRVSEQEARFAFVEALCTAGQFRYSVETPTSETYQFSGEQREISAQTDLTLYGLKNDLKRCRRCNVEFKAGGITPSADCKTKNSTIYKDVQKLLREPVWGLWFHLLESAGSKTIPYFLEVIREGIAKVQGGKYKEEIESPGLTIHVCVLKNGYSLQKDLCPSIDADALRETLCVDMHRKPKPRLNGWKLNERPPKKSRMPTTP